MSIENFITRLKNEELTRILAFGSSNTQRFLSGMHWFDCVELSLRETYGNTNRCINTGIGGDTTRELLKRFEQDAEFYKPHLTFITIGGNDSNPDKNMPKEQFKTNLYELQDRFKRMGCFVIFQTYYAPDPDQLEGPLDNFYQYMQIVRDVAKNTDSHLIDHLSRWQLFRKEYVPEYKGMMQDGFHVNRIGNMLMGLDIARHFKAELGNDRPEYWETVKDYQQRIDQLAKSI